MSFRYHLVSLAAVLLALAGGIVLGSAALAPVSGSHATPAAAPVSTSGDRAIDAFVGAVGPRLLKNALKAQKVLVVLAPDAPAGARKDLVSGLRLAGATVTGQLQLQVGLLDPASAAVVDRVATAVAPRGVTLPQTTPLDRAATELAATLVTSSRGDDASESARVRVLGALGAADLVALEGAASDGPAELVVLLAGPSRGTALATVTAAFARRVGTVVSAPLSATRGEGVLAALRTGDGEASDVDGVDTPAGLLTTILALAEQADGRAGHYGSGPGAGAAAPPLP